MPSKSVRSISISNLIVNTENPRYDPKENQRAAISELALDQGYKLVRLATSIVDKGLNPADLPIVTPHPDGKSFLVQDGNRRVVALKLIGHPSLAASIGLP